MTTLETRPLQPDTDAEDLIALFDAVFGHTVSPLMWEWKYRPPWADRHYCWVGVCEGKVVGYLGAVPLRGCIDGEEVPFFQLADAMVHPKYRLKFDYFSLAHSAILEDIGVAHPRHLIYGFSDHRLFRWFERIGWSGLIEMAVTRRFHPREASRAGRYEFRDWDFTEPEISRCWEMQDGLIRAGLIRDGTYVKWRYGHHPVFPYRLLGVYEEGSSLGWVVLGTGGSIMKNPAKPIPVVDVLLPEAAVEPVFQALPEHLDRTVSVWLPSRVGPDVPDRKVTDTHVYHFVKESAVDTAFLQDHFYYTMGDVDWW